jgi:hypothetical protein
MPTQVQPVFTYKDIMNGKHKHIEKEIEAMERQKKTKKNIDDFLSFKMKKRENNEVS